MARVGTAFIEVLPDMKKFGPAVATEMAAVSSKLKKSTVALGAVATGAGAAGAALFSIGSDFDAANDKIRIGTGKTGKALARLDKDFKAVLKAVPANFDDASQAVTELNRRLGITGRPLRRLSKQVLELSRITGTDLDTNIRQVTRTFGDWGIGLQDQPEALDKMFRASQKTGTAVADLGAQLVRYGAPLRQLGFSFDEAAGLVAKFEQEGVNAQLVLGSLRIALGKMAQQGVRDPAKAIDRLVDSIRNAGSAGEANALALETFGARAGPDMAAAIREGRFDLGRLFNTIENGRDSVKKASEDTQDFSETWLKFKNNVMVALEPLAARVFDGISKEAKALTDILTDKRLSGGEKFEAILDRISGAFEKAIPKVADAAAAAAPRVASAFVNGFINASVWGKLALGGFLLAKFGGLGSFKKIGTKLGGALGLGMAGSAGQVVAQQAPSRLGKATSAFSRIGRRILGPALVGGLAFAMTDARKGLGDRLQDTLNIVSLGIIPQTKEIGDRLRDALAGAARGGDPRQEGFSRFLDQLTDDLPAKEQKIVRSLTGLRERVIGLFGKDTKLKLDVDPQEAIKGIKRLESNLGHLGPNVRNLMARIQNNVKTTMRTVANTLGTNSKAGREALRRQFSLAVGDIQRAMRAGTVAADQGARAIRKIVVQALGTFGIKGAAAIKLAGIYGAQGLKNLGAGNTLRGAPATGNLGGAGARQRGGPIDLGAPSGDTVPAMLERGEYVLNRKAVKAVGKQQLDHLNFKQASRFQTGGIVALGRKLQREGYTVGENPAFGGVAPVHAPNSYHYRGMAIDVNADNFPGGEAGALDKLYARLKRLPGVVELLWRVKDHFDHLHVAMAGAGDLSGLAGLGIDPIKLGHQKLTGPASALKAQVAGALETVRGVGQRVIDRAMENITFEGAEPGVLKGGASGANQVLGRKMAASYGWTGGQWAALRELWTRESGWDANAVNPASGASGIPQALGHGHVFNLGDAQAQIAWGLRYIKDRYGSPSAALAFHDVHNWYRRGGPSGGPHSFTKPGGARLSEQGKITEKRGLGRIDERLQGIGGTGHGFGHAGGPLPKVLRQTLRKVGRAKTKKGRAKALQAFAKKLEKLGLPKKLMGEIKDQANQYALFDQFATSASSLTLESDDGTSVPGVVGGLSEVGWLAKSLGAQFKERNKLVRARAIAVKRRAQVDRAFDLARKRLKDITKGGTTPHAWKGLNPARDSVEKWNKQNQAKRMQGMRRWRSKHGSLPGTREFDERSGKLEAVPASRVSALKKLVPALRDQKKLLNDGIQTRIRQPLELLQGIGGSTKHMRSPWPIGTIPAGSIFDTQLRLRELGAKPNVTDGGGADTSAADERAAEQAELLRGLLREANLRTAVSERQFDVLRNFPPFGGQFATGGVVPGPTGAPRTIIAHGGETVTPPGKDGNVRVVIEDNRVRVFYDDVEQVVKQVTRKQARAGGRVLPGRAGGG